MALSLTYEKKAVLFQTQHSRSCSRALPGCLHCAPSLIRARARRVSRHGTGAQMLKLGVCGESQDVPDAPAVQVLWSDKARRALPSVNIAELRRAFGEDYSACVKETCSISLRSGLSLDAIEKQIGEQAARRCCLCSVSALESVQLMAPLPEQPSGLQKAMSEAPISCIFVQATQLHPV